MDMTFLIRVAAVAMIFAFANTNAPTGLFALQELDCTIYNIEGENNCVLTEDCDEACDPEPEPGCPLIDGGCYDDDDQCHSPAESPFECFYDEPV